MQIPFPANDNISYWDTTSYCDIECQLNATTPTPPAEPPLQRIGSFIYEADKYGSFAKEIA
jgi:hypothetical protein